MVGGRFLLVLAGALLGVSALHAEEIELVDRPAPEFSLPGSDGRTYALADLLNQGGNRGIVLAFFPKAFTPG